jgi:hypothetical protein
VDCDTFEDCASDGEDNRCLIQEPRGQNYCVRICERDEECREGYLCDGIGGGVGGCFPDPAQPLDVDFEAYPYPVICGLTPEDGAMVLEYDVPEGTHAYTFTSIARDGHVAYPTSVHLPSGTSGVNINFSIDPEDPEQIDISDDGSHTFSVIWRIVDHNQEPADPCSSAPPSCCNAFLTTDASGLANPTNNWVSAIDCGPLGCPAGFWRFSAYPSFCRPSGDVVTRVTWSSVSCQPGVGSCCLPTASS